MKVSLKKIFQNQLIAGTLYLTLAGIICRGMGFFYRIFLSRTIGAQGLGLYQLITPVLMLSIALCSAGISTSISRFVSFEPANEHNYFYIGLSTSVLLSFFCSLILHKNANFIALHILSDGKTAPLIRIVSYALVFSSIHNCINGYCYGKKKAILPSLCQLVEQIARILGVFLLYKYCESNHTPFTATCAGWGILFGELASFFTCFHIIPRIKKPTHKGIKKEQVHSFFEMAVPLTSNQLLVHACTSIEFLLIPRMLMVYGYSHEDALSVFGVFTGMALAIIFCPAVLVNSLCVMLLPEIASAKKKCDTKVIQELLHKVLWFGLIFGIFSGLIFGISKEFVANYVFKNALVATFLGKLCFLCPLLYIQNLLQSIMHGHCYSKEVLCINLLSCAIRIGFILFVIPSSGLDAYIWAMILSSAVSVLLQLLILRKKTSA